MPQMPDYMVAKPTQARPKNSLLGTTLDPTPKDDSWIRQQLEARPDPKSKLHDCYEDPFLRMTAYRLEDAVSQYQNTDKDMRSKQEKALYFNQPLPESARDLPSQRNMLALNYERSETNDQYRKHKQLPGEDVYTMNRVGLQPVHPTRLPTGNYNYDKYRPRRAAMPFEQAGQIVLKQPQRKSRDADDVEVKRFPALRSSVMRQVIEYDHKAAMSKREYPLLADRSAPAELPANIRHKFGLRARHNEPSLVNEDEIRDLFSRYDEKQLEMMERHLAAKRRQKMVPRLTQKEIDSVARSNLFGQADQPFETEVGTNYTQEQFDRSRSQFQPPEGARRVCDTYSKWVGLNVLDQKHRQEWKEYMEGKGQPTAA